MNHLFFRIRSFITYWLDAVDAHGLHSPFFFDLYENVLHSRATRPSWLTYETFRHTLLTRNDVLDVLDLGAGSQVSHGNRRTIRDIARASLSPAKFSRVYANLIEHFGCREGIELGTSLGINTLYLASGNARLITTFEGSPAVSGIAQELFHRAGAGNIQVVTGNIDDTLSPVIDAIGRLDFAFLDAHHRYAPTLRYFEVILPKIHARSVVVLDDIHYSPEMEKAWNMIRKHPAVHATADLYRCGLLFFDPSVTRQNVVLRF